MPAPPRTHNLSPVFIYYKLYDDDKKEMIRSRSGHANDPFIGRVDASRVPTPHTVNALAARICKQENRPMGFDWDNNDAYGTMLLRTENSSTAYNPADTVDLLDAERPGSTLQEPVLLKVWCEELQAVFGFPGWERPPARSVTSHRSPVFIYYKVYDDDKKQMICSAVGYAGDPFLGRVDTCQIPTPHTIGALAQHISKQENRPSGLDWDHDDAHGTMLLRTVDSPNAYKLGDAIDLLGANRPGSTPQEPVFLKVWYEELQAVLGFSELETPAARTVDSHRNTMSSS